MTSLFSEGIRSIEGVFEQVGQQQNATRRKFAKKGKEGLRSDVGGTDCNTQKKILITAKVGGKMKTGEHAMRMKCIVDYPRLPRNPSLNSHT
jgi:hypothetical protein